MGHCAAVPCGKHACATTQLPVQVNLGSQAQVRWPIGHLTPLPQFSGTYWSVLFYHSKDAEGPALICLQFVYCWCLYSRQANTRVIFLCKTGDLSGLCPLLPHSVWWDVFPALWPQVGISRNDSWKGFSSVAQRWRVYIYTYIIWIYCRPPLKATIQKFILSGFSIFSFPLLLHFSFSTVRISLALCISTLMSIQEV